MLWSLRRGSLPYSTSRSRKLKNHFESSPSMVIARRSGYLMIVIQNILLLHTYILYCKRGITRANARECVLI